VAGVGNGPGPLNVGAERLQQMLGLTSVALAKHPSAMLLTDSTLA
jgi:hypothetical protein